MSAADGLVRNEEVAGATPATLTRYGRQADISWLHLSRKQDRHRRGESVTRAFRQLSSFGGFMNDGAFIIGHVIFHLVLIAVLHGSRSSQVLKPRREQNQKKTRNQPGMAEQTLRPSPRRAETITTIETKGVP